MRHEKRARAPRPITVLAALGVAALGGCGLSDGYYGGGGSYYGSPSYDRSHHRSGGGHRSSPRTENWSQQRLQQHCLSQAQRPR